MTYLQFKFRESASEAARRGLIQKIKISSGGNVEPLLPGESDAELSCLFMIDLPDGPKIKQVAALLENEPSVEYVEGPPKRKLM